MNLIFRVSMLALVGMLGAACASTPTTQVESFADGVAKVSGELDALVDDYNTQTLDAKLAALVLTHVPGDPALDGLDEATLGEIVVVFGTDERKNLAIFAANRALGTYARSLKVIAEAGSSRAITEATVDLTGSLKALNSNYSELTGKDAPLVSDEDLGLVGAVIVAIGRTIAEQRRRDAIRTIVTRADPHIATIVQAINQGIDDGGFVDSMETDQVTVLNARIAWYQARVRDRSFGSHAEQLSALRSLWDLNQQKLGTAKRVNALKKGFTAIAEAHGLVHAAVTANDFDIDAIVDAVSRLGEVRSELEALRKSIVKCAKVKVEENGDVVCDEVG